MKPKTVEVVICRTCVAECNDFKNLYKQGLLMGEVTTLASLLSFCSNLEFAEDEGSSLPPFICSNCVHDLIRSYIFKKKVLQANSILSSQLGSDETVVEQRNSKEDVFVINDAEADLQELAEAAQMKREQLQQEVFKIHENNDEEYLQLTVLETEVEEENLHHNVEHDQDESEEVELEYMEQEVAETTEIYHTTVISEEIQHLDDNEDLVQDQQQSEGIDDDDKVEYEIQVNDMEEDYAELLTDSQDEMSSQSFKRRMDDGNSGSDNGLINAIAPKRRRINSNKPANPDYQCKVKIVKEDTYICVFI